MTPILWLQDVFAFMAQTAIIVAAGAVVARVFRLRHAGTALNYWRVLLLACLLLPLLQPWRTAAPPVAISIVQPSSDASDGPPPPTVHTPDPRRWPRLPDFFLVIIVGGVVARAIRLAFAATSLRRLRLAASPLLPLPRAIETASARVGVSADVYVSDHIAGPITFGARRPRILLPPGIVEMDARMVEAIACHELVHVRRRDWIAGIGEEAVRTVCWFNPAIWWLIGRIQLAREQVVDLEVIALTNARDSYLDALLCVALARTHHALVPAPLFVRRGLLKQRIAGILEESTMTKPRLIVCLSASAAALAIVGTMAVRAFPLHAQATNPGGRSDRPVEIVAGGENLLHGETPEYPGRAVERGIEGDVVVQVAVNDEGEVSDARVVSGPDDLRRSALAAVLQWHFSPAALRSTTADVTLRFHLQAARVAAAREQGERRGFAFEAKTFEFGDVARTERQLVELQHALSEQGVAPAQEEELKRRVAEVRSLLEQQRAARDQTNNASPVVAEIRSERISDATRSEILARAAVRIGDPFTEEAGRRIRAAAASVDPHIRVEFGRTERGIVVAVIAP
jgi:TonB family protein